MSIGIIGAGRVLGSRIHTNEDLAATAGITPEDVLKKTGIVQRHYAVEGQTTSSMALEASRRAIGATINQGDEKAPEIDLIIGATFTADYLFPPLSAKLHRDLGCKGGLFFDVQANCSGYVTGLVTAVRLMESSTHAARTGAVPFFDYGLVVGAELLSPFVNPADAETAMFFSDGAGAVVLGWKYDGGFISAAFDSDTSNYESVRCRRDGFMEQAGLATWKQAVTNLPKVIVNALDKAGWRMDEVDLFIPHQANLVLLEFLARRLGLSEALYTNVASVGNTGAASIPIAIADAVTEGRLTYDEGMKVVIAGIGAGFGFAASCWEF